MAPIMPIAPMPNAAAAGADQERDYDPDERDAVANRVFGHLHQLRA
jgi:hypothetical protein